MINKIRDVYEYIQEEAFTIDELENWPSRILSAFPAFKYANYRLYFVGQLASLIGTWLQMVAEGWLVLELTHSAFWVGVEAAASTIPILIFTLFGGVIVDRFNKKYILIFTQTVSMILALTLGFLVVGHLVNLWEMIVLAFFLGCVNALDMPARQSFVVDLVERKDLSSAIALNAAMFNGARVIGPGIAGALIAIYGTGGAFTLNGLSYIAVIIALLFMTTKYIKIDVHPHPIKAIKEGIAYSFSNSSIKELLALSAVTSIFGWSYSTIMPVIVSDVFHQGAATLGHLLSVAGLGALTSALLVSAVSKKIDPMKLIFFGNLLFGVSVMLFSFTTNIFFASIFLYFAGCGILLQFSLINVTIQHLVADNLRGRVLSIYTLTFLGLTPIGSLQVGLIAERFGSEFAIRFGSAVILLYGTYLFIQRKRNKKISQALI